MTNGKQSFIDFAKEEILKNLPEDTCCKKAWLAGAVKAIGSLQPQKAGYVVVFEYEEADYLSAVAQLIKGLYFTPVELAKKGKEKRAELSVTVPHNVAELLLTDTGIVTVDEEGPHFTEGVNAEVIRNKCCAASFLKSLFLVTGKANVPSKRMVGEEKMESNGGGYYLEFVLADELLAEFVQRVLAALDVTARTVERKSKWAVYVKDSEDISALFALFGANETVMYIQEIMVERIVVENLNRQINRDTANADKAAMAAAKQLVAINLIAEVKGLDSLPEHLRELAEMRIANPTATADFFVENIVGISKSGINHRFRRLIEMADELKKAKEGN